MDSDKPVADDETAAAWPGKKLVWVAVRGSRDGLSIAVLDVSACYASRTPMLAPMNRCRRSRGAAVVRSPSIPLQDGALGTNFDRRNAAGEQHDQPMPMAAAQHA